MSLRRRALMVEKQKLWLYKDGEQYVDITGGWTYYVDRNNAYAHFNAVNIETRSEFVYEIYGANVLLYTVNKIDVSNANRLFIHLPMISRTMEDSFGFLPAIELFLTSEITELPYWKPSNFDYSTVHGITKVETKNNITISVDLSNVFGSYYIGIRNRTSTGDSKAGAISIMTATIDGFWLE